MRRASFPSLTLPSLPLASLPLLVFASLPSLVLASLATVGCGSKTSDNIVTDTGADTGSPDVKPGDTPEDVPPIEGSLDITIRVVTADNASKRTPVPDFAARIENAARGRVEATTDADGVAHLKVDPAKGPFDVTVAKAGYVAISVLGVTGPVGDVITFANGAAAIPKEFGVGGSISGKINAGNKVQLDAWAFHTQVVTTPAWNSKYTMGDGVDLPMPIAGIEVAGGVTPTAINGAISKPVTRTGMVIGGVHVDFPATPNTPTNSTLNVKFPASGVITGTTVSKIGNTTTDMFLGNTLVVQTKFFAQMFVGIAIAGEPASNNSKIALQSFGGSLAPDQLTVAYVNDTATSGGVVTTAVIARLKNLTNGSTTEIPQVTTLDVAGTELGALQFTADGTGYEYSALSLFDPAPGGSTFWICYAKGPKLTTRGLPYLPTTVPLGDVTGVNPAGLAAKASMILVHRTGASATPWADLGPADVTSAKYLEAIDAVGR